MNEIDSVVERANVDEDVLAVVLFGSSVEGEGRDLDVCLVMKEGVDCESKLIDYSGRSFGKVDLSVFQLLPVYIRVRVLRGKVLFCRDVDELYKKAFDTLKEFDSYKKVYDMCLESAGNG